MNPPCIILYNRTFSCYEAFNEDGRFLCRRADFWECKLITFELDYDMVPTNSRCGRTILDKLNKNKQTI